jgi:hypothetical protein
MFPVLMENKFTAMLAGIIRFLQDIGGYVVIIAGIILMIVGVVQIVKGLAGGGKGQTNWVMSIGALVVGGALAFGGWSLVANLAESAGGAVQGIDDYGSGDSSDLGGNDVRGGAKDWSGPAGGK